MSDYDRTLRNVRNLRSTSLSTGDGVPAPSPTSFPDELRLGPDAALAVEWEWSTWHQAVGDRCLVLAVQRAEAADRWHGRPVTSTRIPRRIAPARLAVLALTVALSLGAYVGLIAFVRTLVAHPQMATPIGLAALAFVGVALGRRR